MLKRICELLVLGMVVCAGSACVTPTHASSAPGVVISHVYPAADGAANELIGLFNNTPEKVDITGWCIVNDAGKDIACLKERGFEYFIDAYSYVAIVSSAYAEKNSAQGLFDITYEPLSKTSGSLVGTKDSVNIKDIDERVIDRWSWSEALGKNSGFIRNQFDPDSYSYLEGSIIGTAPMEQVFGGGLIKEVVEAINYSGHLSLSEALPNPKGADAGGEFIEIYNQSDVDVPLSDFALRVIGGVGDKTYALSSFGAVGAGAYGLITDLGVGFSLNNTAGAIQLLYSPTGLPADYEVVDEAVYSSPPEAWSWAYFDESGWQYTNRVTPGLPNERISEIDIALAAVQVPASCRAGQAINTATGRCKKISTVSLPTPCKADQYRSSDTGRCRSNTAVAGSMPCKEGQERSAETNRCRNIVKMTKASNGVVPKETSVEVGIRWYAWAVVGIIVACILGYGAWEWRVEIQGVWRKFREKAAR